MPIGPKNNASSSRNLPKLTSRDKSPDSTTTSPTKLPSLSKSREKSKDKKPFDFSLFPTRKIALKFCYAGWEYNGLASHSEPTALPMVEDVLLKALRTTRLIDPDSVGMEGCEWSRCGRTDKGVSGAGQVVSLRVRCAGSKKTTPPETPTQAEGSDVNEDLQKQSSTVSSDAPQSIEEIRYVTVLNNALPPSIRILAWSPVADDFDARFSCTYRHYKYFFNAKSPPYGSPTSTLDIPLMQQAASRLVGEHDFQNLCKPDPSKQIDNFHRRIIHASITAVSQPFAVGAGSSTGTLSPGGDIKTETSGTSLLSDLEEPLYVLDLKGNGFLYHQVRHIMAILFLIGAKLEDLSLLDALFNTDPSNPLPPLPGSSEPLPIVSRKPGYQMADGIPLVLWDCGYAEGAVSWRTDSSAGGNAAYLDANPDGILHTLHTLSTEHLIKMTIFNHFLLTASRYHTPPPPATSFLEEDQRRKAVPSRKNARGIFYRVPLGSGQFLQTTKYQPVLSRSRSEPVAIMNERWKTGAGVRKAVRREAKKRLLPETPSAEDGDHHH